MPSDYDNQLLRYAIIHLRANEVDIARRYLERALDTADDTDTRVGASYWMSTITEDPARKRALLDDVLAFNRQHPEARRALAILNGELNPEDIIDPNALPEDPQEIHANADRFMCPKCGARMVFSPDGRSLLCEYCTRNERLSMDPKTVAERDFFASMATAQGHRAPVSTQVFACKGCGAQFILAPRTISATCAYCASPHVMDVGARRELVPPDLIIPFAFDRRAAAHHLVDWAKRQNLTPSGQVQAPLGVYLPVWLFDLGGQADFTAVIVVRKGRSREYRTVRDTHPVLVDNLPVAASLTHKELIANALPGYNFRAAQPYDPRYLSDWPADLYDISMADASLEARQIAFRKAERAIRNQIDGEVWELNASSAKMSVESFQLVLLPAWLTNFPLDGVSHPLLINGQSGEVHFQKPQSFTTLLGDLFANFTGLTSQ